MGVFVAFAWILFAAWAIDIGRRKGHLMAGIVLGITTAWIGVIIMLCLPYRRRLCARWPGSSSCWCRWLS